MATGAAVRIPCTRSRPFKQVDTTIHSNAELDVLVVGGGVAGLWCLDALVEAGYNAALLESKALGTGQSISAQGILHGGVKYSLTGLLAASSSAISEMPERWDHSLDGARSPDLRAVRVRTEACHLWRTESLRSIAGMAGAKLALRVRPRRLAPEDRPAVLKDCPGDVALLPEKGIETPSLMSALAALHPDRIALGELIDGDASNAELATLRVRLADGEQRTLRTRRVVLTAGAGTPGLMDRLALPGAPLPMQRRPLHMAMVRGAPDRLPELNGHCADGGRTRVTVTSSTSQAGHRVWQLGGELAERGCSQEPGELIEAARSCLDAVLPGFDAGSDDLTWATYRIDRAEKKTNKSGRPAGAYVGTTGAAVIAWPTKLVLAPATAQAVLAECESLGAPSAQETPFAGRKSPSIALPPWEEAQWN